MTMQTPVVVYLFDCLLLQGRFTIAAKHHVTIAEIYETELVDIDKVSPSHYNLI